MWPLDEHAEQTEVMLEQEGSDEDERYSSVMNIGNEDQEHVILVAEVEGSSGSRE